MCKEFFSGVVVPTANLAAEPYWRDPHDSTEDLREMTLIGEAGRRSCAGQGDLRIAQVLLRAFSSNRCQASTCLCIGSKLRCIRSTPAAMQSINENDFECFASTGVKSPLNAMFE
jgi:hypothetical protein